jgi:predicted ester cyclase
VKLTTTFPDFRITNDDVIQEGNKVVVRSTITGTQAKEFMGFPSKNRRMTMQAIDIHEFKDGDFVHTWHSEDWMTGLHQLGIFDK